MKRLVALAAVSALFLVGCGGGDDDSDPVASGDSTGMADMPGMKADGSGGGEHADHGGKPTASCTPGGSSVSITANGTKFDKDCLAVPADQPFTINYDNKDALAHNIAILTSHSATDTLFKAEIFRGPAAKSLNVNALKAGTYAFHCEVHPTLMSGTFLVK